MLQKYRLVDPHLWRGKWVLGAILTSFLLLASAVWAAAPTRLDPTVVHLASLRTTTDHRLASHTALRTRTITMFSNGTGWAASQSHIYHVIHRGRTWVPVTPSHLPQGSVLSLDPLSETQAAVAVSSVTSANRLLTLYVTRNGGRHWASHPVPYSHNGIDFLDFLNPNLGWIGTDEVGASGTETLVLLKTINGGQNFFEMPSSISPKMVMHGNFGHQGSVPIGNKTGVVFSSPTTGWITGIQNGGRTGGPTGWTAQSVNGGSTWTPAHLSGKFYWIYSPVFWGSHLGLLPVNLSPDRWRVYRTTNNGHSWIPGAIISVWGPGYTSRRSFWSWSLTTSLDGWVVAERATNNRRPLLYITHNGGVTWNRELTNLPLQEISHLDMITPQAGFAITRNSAQQTLWHTNDGARHWRKVSYRITKPA